MKGPALKPGRFNTQAAHIENLIYSKVHDMWASKKEYDYLSQLLKSSVKSAPKPTEQSQAKPEYKSTGVKGSVKTNTYSGAEDQKSVRERLERVYKADSKNLFLQSLNRWKHDFSPKQAYWINKYYEDKYGSETPIPKSNVTEQEANDPNWTPWND